MRSARASGLLRGGRRGRWHINARILHQVRGVLLIIALATIVTACGADAAATPTPRPPTPIPPTPTPRSTALPALAEPPALLGGQARPLTISFALTDVMAPSEADRAALAQAVADALQPLSQTLNLADDVEVQILAADESAALRAVCSGAPVTAWVSAFTYAAAARACDAQPLLALVHEDEGDATIGVAYDVVTSVEVATAADLAGQSVCRVDGQLAAWAITSLMLRAEGVAPLAEMSHGIVYEDETAALRALLDGECAVLPLPRGTLEDLLDPLPASDENPADRLHILIAGGDASLPTRQGDTSLAFPAYVVPYGLWIAAPDPALPAGELRPLREELTDAVIAYLDTNPGKLDNWFTASEVIAVDEAGLARLRRWLDDANWDMAYRP